MSKKDTLTAESLKVLESVPDLYLIISTELHILTASDAYLKATLSERDKIIGKPLFEAFPDNPAIPQVNSIKDLDASLHQLISSCKPQQMPLQKYNVQLTPSMGGDFEEKYWEAVNFPVQDEWGNLLYIIHKISDVTERVKSQQFKNLIDQQAEREKEKLKEGERKLRLITDSLPVLIGYLDKEVKYRFANKAYETWFPIKAEELLGRPVREVVGEEAYRGVEGYINRALAGERIDFKAKMPYREDFVKYIHTSYIPDIQDGEVAGFYTLVTDVTEQSRALERLEESEEKYRSLFETMDQGFCILEMIFDPDNKPIDYRFLETNPTFERQTGLNNAKGKTALELVPDLEAHWFEIYGKVALTGEAVNFTQGSEAMGRWFEVHAFSLGGRESRKVALLFTDITERKRSEQALRDSQERYQRVIEGSNEGIWDWDFGKDSAWWNHRFNEILGVNIPEEKRSISAVSEFIHPEDREVFFASLDTHLKRKEKFEIEYRIIRPSGEIRYVLSKGMFVPDQNGDSSMISGTITDFTERKKAEEDLKLKNEQLTRINNDLDNFIYTASHDLKAPILNIEGLVSLLNKFIPPDAENQEKLNAIMEMIHTSVGRFKETIKDLSEVAKVQSNSEEEVGKISFEEILEEVVLNIQSQVEEADTLLNIDFSAAPEIFYSKKNLRSIMYNLVSNAIKYRSPHRPLQINIHTSRPDQGHIVLNVQDNGLGIKEKDKAKVFMMFKRLHQHVDGTGMGMAIVKKIIDNSRGRIELESEEGKGSLFKIFFKV